MQAFPYDAVVFDLDGTLCDAEDGIVSSVVYTLEQLGISIPDKAELRKVVGPPLRDSFRNLFGIPEELMEKAVKMYQGRFATHGMYRYSVYPNIRGLLQTLKDNGIYTALATSKPVSTATPVLDYFGLGEYLTMVVGEEEGAEKIGKPGLIRKALEKGFHHPVMVGDRKFDIEGAKANGIDSIGVAYGCGTVEELQAAGATQIVSSTRELRDLLCPEAPMPKGFFLTVEGPDGSGKTTQTDRLESKLRQFGYTVHRTREPGGCAVSEEIRRVILDPSHMEMCDTCEALLYAAARAQHVHQVIRPAVENGELVLCDRFVDSSVAYQGGGREIGVDKIKAINAPAVDGMLPDATLYLSIDAKEALMRRLNASQPDRLEMQTVAFHERVQKAYEQMVVQEPERFLVVNAAKTPDEVAAEVEEKVLNRLLPWRKA